MSDGPPLEPPPTNDPETSQAPLSPNGADEKAWTELIQMQFLAGYTDADGVYDTLE